MCQWPGEDVWQEVEVGKVKMSGNLTEKCRAKSPLWKSNIWAWKEVPLRHYKHPRGVFQQAHSIV
jgi:hypothetical protein